MIQPKDLTAEQFEILDGMLKHFVKDFPESIDLKPVLKTGSFNDKNKVRQFKEFYIQLTGNITVRNACNCNSTYIKIIYDLFRYWREFKKNNNI